MKEIVNNLTYKDLKNLPVKLYKELNIPHYVQREFLILNILEKNNGIADINFIMVRIYNETKEILTRKNMWNILGKMREKNLIESAEKKGYYKTKK